MKKKLLIITILIMAMVFTSTVGFAASSTSKYTGTSFNHNDKFSDHLVVDVLDVSEWQNTIDWPKVKADGIDAVIIRVGGRGYGAAGRMYFDSNYARNLQGAKDAGIMIGVYYFSQAITEAEAVAEANHAIQLLGNTKIELPIFMDYEFASDSANPGRLKEAKLSKAQATDIAKKFCQTVEAAGYDAGFYANYSFLTKTVDGSILSSLYTVWSAQYYHQNDYKNNYSIWQYSSSGKVSGISGRVDCNFWYLSKTPTATQAKSIVNCEVLVDSCAYKAGTNHKPEVTVTYNGNLLTEGVDYRVGYIDNRNIGTGHAYVTGIGQYADYKITPFDISESMGIDSSLGVTSSAYTIGNYVNGVALNTSLATFTSNIAVGEGYTFKVLNSGGTQITSGVVGTGSKLEIYDSDSKVVGNAVIVARGDSDGNGLCNLADLLRMRKQIMGLSSYSGAQFYGLDINKDKKVGLSDLLAVRKHIMGLKYI